MPLSIARIIAKDNAELLRKKDELIRGAAQRYREFTNYCYSTPCPIQLRDGMLALDLYFSEGWLARRSID